MWAGVWLYRTTTWRVESRKGEAGGGRGNTWTYDDEVQARAMVRRLPELGGPLRLDRDLGDCCGWTSA
jgi:hypothetical protein